MQTLEVPAVSTNLCDGIIKLKGSLLRIVPGFDWNILQNHRVDRVEKLVSVKVLQYQHYLHSLQTYPIRIALDNANSLNLGSISELIFIEQKPGPTVTWDDKTETYSYWVLAANPVVGNFFFLLLDFKLASKLARY